MRLRTMHNLQGLRGARDFLRSRDVPVALGSVRPTLDALTDVIAQMEAHAVEQEVRDRGARAATRGAAQHLDRLVKECLRPIARTGAMVFHDDPELARMFTVPRTRVPWRLLACAHALAALAERHRERFVAAGFRPDFVETVRDATNAVLAALDTQARDGGGRAAATSGLDATLWRGRRLVRLLDAVVAPRLAGAPEALGQWRACVRAARRRR